MALSLQMLPIRFGLRAAAVAIGLCASAAYAAPLELRYSATWGGGPAAEIVLSLDEHGGAFRNQLDIRTVGLARWLSGFKARAVSEGHADTAVTPLAYDAVYDSRKKRDKRINVQFVREAQGTLAEDGPLDSSTDPLLPEALRRDVIDPLSCLTAIRRMIQAHRLDRNATFTFAVYDGKRRFDVEGSVRSTENVRWSGAHVQAVNLRLLLRPVAGFDGETEDDYKPAAETREVEVAFTNDSRAIPLRMSVAIAYVPAVIVLDGKTKL